MVFRYVLSVCLRLVLRIGRSDRLALVVVGSCDCVILVFFWRFMWPLVSDMSWPSAGALAGSERTRRSRYLYNAATPAVSRNLSST